MTANTFTQFRRLLPRQPLLVGTVVSSADGAVVVQILGGDQLSIRGTATPGEQVFFRAGVVEGTAPALALVNIDV